MRARRCAGCVCESKGRGGGLSGASRYMCVSNPRSTAIPVDPRKCSHQKSSSSPQNSIVRFGPAKRGASARLSAIPPAHHQPCGCPMRVREGTLLHEGEQRVHDPRVRLQVHPMLLAQAIGSGKPQLGRLETSAGQGKEGGNADSNMVEFL
jgi:hypothetical protein